ALPARPRSVKNTTTSMITPPTHREAAERCTQSASSDHFEEPRSTAEWPDSDSPEAKARERANAAQSRGRRSVSQLRKSSAATRANPSVIAMKALPKRVPFAIGERSP